MGFCYDKFKGASVHFAKILDAYVSNLGTLCTLQ